MHSNTIRASNIPLHHQSNSDIFPVTDAREEWRCLKNNSNIMEWVRYIAQKHHIPDTP